MKHSLFLLFAFLFVFTVCSYGQRVTQFGTLQDLLDARLEGSATLGDMLERGDFGLGTFDGLDGEMIVLEGRIFQVKADGEVFDPPMSLGTPFAVVTDFESEASMAVPQGSDFAAVAAILKETYGADGIMALRVDGDFTHMHTRSVPKQSVPYPGLLDILKTQPEFKAENIQGTLVGFRFPAHAQGTNAAGEHFHFISEDASFGGHVIDFEVDTATLSVMECTEWLTILHTP